MSNRTGVAALTLGLVLALGGCTDTSSPEAVSTPISNREEPNPQALLSAAQDALRKVDAVRVLSHAVVTQGTDNVVRNWHTVWSGSPPAWLASNTVHLESGPPITQEWRYRDNDLYARTNVRHRRRSTWVKSAPKWLGANPDTIADLPVAVALKATAVGAVDLTDGVAIRAEVPNAVADRWFGVTGLLASNGLPGVLKGGMTRVSITLDDAGFPVKVAYTGDDMGLTTDIPDYMQGNLAASELTAYYRPTTVPRELQSKPSTEG
jgi:hypothetical protein